MERGIHLKTVKNEDWISGKGGVCEPVTFAKIGYRE
jgi:hypothetical protein